MGKNKFIKWLVPLGVGMALMFGSPQIQYKIDTVAETESFQSASESLRATDHIKIYVFDEKLSNALRTILGKKSNEHFYADDFLIHEKFKPITITDEESGISTTTAMNYQLDLSNTGTKDIRELAQFKFPETLQAINLSGNNITQKDMENIDWLLNTKNDQSFALLENIQMVSRSDFSSLILKVNLNNNELDLNKLGNTYLDNTKYIFGFQNLGSIDRTGLVKSGEINPSYYIRENTDENILNFKITHALSTEIGSIIPLKYNTVSTFVDTNLLDKYTISVSSVPDSSTAYFKGYNFIKEFVQFDISIDPDFKVERTSLLNLNIRTDSNGILDLSQSPLNIEGFGNNSNLKITYESPSTSKATTDEFKNYVHISLNYNNETRTIPLEFKVEDTIKPVIKLIGTKHAYISKNREYNDPGVIAYDPGTEGAEDGDPLTQLVTRSSTLNINELGIYKIIYSVSDLSGKTAFVERIVEVQEKVLDRVIVRAETPQDKIMSDKEILLSIQVEKGTPINRYTNIKYYWYVNDILFQTTNADSSGKSVVSYIPNKPGTYTIKVKVTADQISNSAQIEFFSEELDIVVPIDMNSNDMVIIATTVVVGLILFTIIGISIHKYIKKQKITSGKHKNFIKGKKSKNTQSTPQEKGPEIQIIRDYKPPTDNSTTSNNVNIDSDGNIDTQTQDNNNSDKPQE